MIAIGGRMLWISDGTQLRAVFPEQASHFSLTLDSRRVVAIAGVSAGCLVLMADGIVYATAPPAGSRLEVASAAPPLRVVTPLLGPPVAWFGTFRDEVVVVYRDGCIVFASFGQFIHDVHVMPLATLPAFPYNEDAIAQIAVSDEWIWFLGQSGNIWHVAKEPFVSQSCEKVARIKRAQFAFVTQIRHIRFVNGVLYFFERDFRHQPIVVNAAARDLPNRLQPFFVQTRNNGPVLVDPQGAVSNGLRPGDHVLTAGGDHLTVLGTHGDELVVKRVWPQAIDVISLPSLETVLFQWKLINRVGSRLIDVEVEPKMICQVDTSRKALNRLSFFKAGDVLSHSQFGIGRVIGERCGNLWIQYPDGCRMFRGQINLSHRFMSRPGVDVLCKLGPNQEQILIEPRKVDHFEPGSLVQSTADGIGVFHGLVGDFLAISFLRDGFCSVVPRATKLTVKRSVSSQTQRHSAIDGSTQAVDIGEHSCDAFGLKPCDIVRFDDKVAICVGLGSVGGVPSVLFETETTIKHGIGIGVLAVGNFTRPIDIIARVAAPGKIRQEIDGGTEVELSIDTDNFTDAAVLPGDVLDVDGTLCTVVGIRERVLYGNFQGVCRRLGDQHRLIYRRLAVPTICVVNMAGEDMEGWIDLEHLRDCCVGPGDVIDDNGMALTVIAVENPGHLAVVNQLSKTVQRFVLSRARPVKVIRTLV
jgi:hypothetical protein